MKLYDEMTEEELEADDRARQSARSADPTTHWCRIVLYKEAKKYIESLCQSELDVLEISGTLWRGPQFKSYTSTDYTNYDVCNSATAEKYDLIILDQVLEHVRYPQIALENVRRSLRPHGTCFIATPFLIRVHPDPLDLWRWTESGLRCLLEDAGFTEIATGSWGNRACAAANLNYWMVFDPAVHSLLNETDVPVTVWAHARGLP
jgi:SAM-dependent methyltransferase